MLQKFYPVNESKTLLNDPVGVTKYKYIKQNRHIIKQLKTR